MRLCRHKRSHFLRMLDKVRSKNHTGGYPSVRVFAIEEGGAKLETVIPVFNTRIFHISLTDHARVRICANIG